jgi:hypothetical protein
MPTGKPVRGISFVPPTWVLAGVVAVEPADAVAPVDGAVPGDVGVDGVDGVEGGDGVLGGLFPSSGSVYWPGPASWPRATAGAAANARAATSEAIEARFIGRIRSRTPGCRPLSLRARYRDSSRGAGSRA